MYSSNLEVSALGLGGSAGFGRTAGAIPISGFKSRQQVEDNAGAMAFGPLGEEQMRQVKEIPGQAEWLTR
ncbi:MAG TPA: hypothetical protein VF707_01030 [Ardenticatenaceae bacterium]